MYVKLNIFCPFFGKLISNAYKVLLANSNLFYSRVKQKKVYLVIKMMTVVREDIQAEMLVEPLLNNQSQVQEVLQATNYYAKTLKIPKLNK